MRSPDEIRKFLEEIQTEIRSGLHIHEGEMQSYMRGIRDGLYWIVGLYEHMDDIIGGKIQVKSPSHIDNQ